MTTTTRHPDYVDTPPDCPPVLDLVIPVYNEEAALEASVDRVRVHLRQTFPYPFRITVADNASVDRTWAIAQQLAQRWAEVRAVHLDEKGRGRALRQVWSSSDASILCYLDVDLSTDLAAVLPLVAPLLSGHSDLAIGSRLANGARVVRGGRREVISRAYNALLRVSLRTKVSDAQCGFKAVRADVAALLLPHVSDPGWFFDTELLVLAERCGLRIHEVPVDWYDDPDSRVDIVATALHDLRGILRVRRDLAIGRLPVGRIAARIGRGPMRTGRLVQTGGAGRRIGRSPLARFAGVGAASTALHLGLFTALTLVGLPHHGANAMALVAATMANTTANRHWTFGRRGRQGRLCDQARGAAVFGLTLALTAAGLAALRALAPQADPAWATLTVGTATAAATGLKFVLFRRWFAPQFDNESNAPRFEESRTPTGRRFGGGGGI